MIASLLVGGCATGGGNQDGGFTLQTGDLLFQDSDGGPLAEAIETVTQGVDGANLTHVGMVAGFDQERPLIIEAIGEGVVETPLATFLARSTDAHGKPKVLVGRLRAPYQPLIPEAIAHARTLLGRPYDRVFAIDNDAYYCSELLYEAFRDANDGTPVFELQPMTFKDPATDATFPAWATYYAELGDDIPEGKPGLNPGGMSRSPALEIVHAYGSPDGWR
jgi:hypothetical protein